MARSVIGELVWRVLGDTSQIDRALPGTERKVSGLNKSIGLAEASALGMAAALAVVAKQAFDAGKAFDQGLGNVATLLNDPTASIEGLKNDVKDLAIDTGLSLDNLTGGLYQVVSAFGDTAESTLQLEQAAKAAKAGVATVTDAVSLASSVTKAYGDTSAEAQQKVFDLAFQTVKLGETNFPQLAAAMQNVTDRSQALGVSQEELFATMATLTGVTGDANKVSTQLKSALVALDSPTETLAALYKKLGVESGRALIEQNGLQGAFKLIQEDSEASGISMNDYLGRVEAVTAASALATSQSDTYSAKLLEVTNSSGAASEAFAVQTEALNGTAFEYDRAKQSLEVFKTTLYDFYSEDLSNLFSGLTNIITLFGNLNDSVQEAQERFGVFGDVIEALTPVGLIKEYNNQFFKLVGSIGKSNDELGKTVDSQAAGYQYAQDMFSKQEEITAELQRQQEEVQAQADEMQRLVDIENERVSKVVQGRELIEDSHKAELRSIEAKNALGLLAEEDYRNQRLEAEQKLVDDLIAIGYDGLQRKANGELEEGNKLIQASLERQKELVENEAATEQEIWNKALLDYEERHGETFEKTQEDLAAYNAKLKQSQDLMVSVATVGITTMLQGFSDLGEELYNGELSWNSFARVGLNAVAAMLDAIGQQLAALAALAVIQAATGINLGASVAAGPALLGSAAAFAGAGVIRGLAGSFEQGTESIPYPSGVSPTGDKVLAAVNPGERIVPEDEATGGQYIFEFSFDDNVFARAVVNNINKGRNTISMKRGLRA